MDTSALVKLVVPEAETPALQARVVQEPLVASELVVTELVRAVRRRREATPALLAEVELLLGGVRMVPLDRALLRAAGQVGPAALRSLDALHLATALRLGTRVRSLVTYDVRMAAAAEAVGVVVEAPS